MASRLGKRLRAKSKTKNLGYLLFVIAIFLSAIWLSHGKLLAIIEETVPDVIHCIWAISFESKGGSEGLGLHK